MIRWAVITATLGLAAVLFPVFDENSKTQDKPATGKSTDGKPIDDKGQKMSHEEQIAAMFKDHPFIDNPKGVLRKSSNYNGLKGLSAQVINHKYTERAFTGELWNHKGQGTYICKKCNCPLYRSSSKFESHCGWPSFDDEIVGTVTRIPDKDGQRIEIVCTNCGGHLGHVFLGEQFTAKNTRHCVNSASISFVAENEKLPIIIVSDDAKKLHSKEKPDLKKAGETKPSSQEGKGDGKTGNSK